MGTLNAARARRAMKALKTFAPQLRVNKSNIEGDITDLITNLFHLCAEEGLSASQMKDKCYKHFIHERGEIA